MTSPLVYLVHPYTAKGTERALTESEKRFVEHKNAMHAIGIATRLWCQGIAALTTLPAGWCATYKMPSGSLLLNETEFVDTCCGLIDHCDAVLVCRGYKMAFGNLVEMPHMESEGCKREIASAKAKGVKVHYSERELRSTLRGYGFNLKGASDKVVVNL